MKLMKKITKFILNLTSVGSIVLIATLNPSQFAVMKGATPNITDGPITEPGGPRFIQPTEDIDAPPSGRVRSVRGGCASTSQLSLTALVPKNKIGRTVSDYPTFFFYLPPIDAELAEFILEDESRNPIYQQEIAIKNVSGVIAVSIPANTNVPPLEVGKNYTWKFTVVCDPQDRSSDLFESGIVRRVELSPDILGELENADPRQKTFIYAQNGIWQDALSNLAAVRRANPNEPVFQTDWESLLESVTLGKIAKEPIVEMEAQP
jgi:hypothetical protein